LHTWHVGIFFKLKIFSCFYTQACHLLNILSKELLGDFEPFAELFIPVISRANFNPPIHILKQT
jgi:hypothetical protein